MRSDAIEAERKEGVDEVHVITDVPLPMRLPDYTDSETISRAEYFRRIISVPGSRVRVEKQFGVSRRVYRFTLLMTGDLLGTYTATPVPSMGYIPIRLDQCQDYGTLQDLFAMWKPLGGRYRYVPAKYTSSTASNNDSSPLGLAYNTGWTNVQSWATMLEMAENLKIGHTNDYVDGKIVIPPGGEPPYSCWAETSAPTVSHGTLAFTSDYTNTSASSIIQGTVYLWLDCEFELRQ